MYQNRIKNVVCEQFMALFNAVDWLCMESSNKLLDSIHKRSCHGIQNRHPPEGSKSSAPMSV